MELAPLYKPDTRLDMELESRIKALTTLIHLIRPQHGTSTPGNAQSANARAYHNIATLLTRGVEDRGCSRRVVAVTGAHTVTGAIVTAVSAGLALVASPASTSDPVLSNSLPLDKDLAKVHPSVTQNSTRTDLWTGFHLERVEPNTSALLDIYTTLDETNPESVTLSQHAADVLKALNSTRGHPVASSEHTDLFILSMKLVLRRCFPKLKHRMYCVKFLFEGPWMSQLKSWAPESTETLNSTLIEQSRRLLSDVPAGEIWVKIPFALRVVFDEWDIPTQLRSDVPYHQFNASAWLKCLVAVFSTLQDVVENFSGTEDDSVRSLYSSINALYSYVYDLHDFLDAIFQMPSLIHLLDTLRNKHTRLRGNDRSQPMQPGDADFEAEFIPEPNENNSRLFLRYLKTVVAWMRALCSLNGSKLFRSGLDITLNIIHYPTQDRNEQLSFDTLLKELLPYDKLRDEIQMELLPPSKSPRIFTGPVHCEAMLMGLVTACTEKPTNPKILPEFVELLKDSNRVIGVGKKCCWTCNFLAQKLKTPESHFQLPGTSGIIFPWAPPIGIPLHVLEELNHKLTHILETILSEYVQSQIKERTTSHQSSPSSSDNEYMGQNDDIDATEGDHGVGFMRGIQHSKSS